MSRHSKAVEQPFAKWPAMKFEAGEQAFHITGGYRAPSDWWSNTFPFLVLFASIFVMPWSCISVHGGFEGMQFEYALTYTIGYVVVVFGLLMLADFYFRKRRLNVKFSRDAIEVDGKRYDRNTPHLFAIEDHAKAFRETRAARQGLAGARTYRDAKQVVMRYGERRIPIAAFDLKHLPKAEALLLRLQSIDKTVEQRPAEAGETEPFAPGDSDAFGKPPPIR